MEPGIVDVKPLAGKVSRRQTTQEEALTAQDVRVAVRKSIQHSLQAGRRSSSLLYDGMLKESPQGCSSLH